VNALVAFNFEGQGVVRVVDRDGNPWFVLADVCKVLGLGNPSAVAARLDPDEKDTLISNEGIRSGPGNPNVTLINESGLHALVMSSRKPAAKRFRKWVTSEVIPSVLRTGSYGVQRDPLEMLDDPHVLRGLLVKQLDRAAASEAQIAIMRPKAAAADRLEAADGSKSMTVAAKDLDMKPGALIAKLQAMRWIYKSSAGGPWIAAQTALNTGRMEHRAHTFMGRDGRERLSHQAMITAKGMIYLAKHLSGAIGGEEQLEAA
jgi:prophage antirepressor-like protein